MKIKLTLLALFIISIIFLQAQQGFIIDHNCLNINNVPFNWVDSAKTNLWIGYGHTSHGSQLASGMDAVESHFPAGTYNWSHDGGAGELHLFEGAGYGSGYLELDCGYAGWDDKTREYLDDHPGCNVIIWSWCGQVNSVDLQSHYLGPMEQLETDYPDVKFVYMTGHLEGLGSGGSVFTANQQIRNYCTTNDKILFDFADIEKYDPDAEVDYQQYNADDACNYNPPAGGTANWANDWLAAHPNHVLSQMSQLCGSCAHSVSLNCVKKGLACWYLWARIAGWDGGIVGINKNDGNESRGIKVYPVPVSDEMTIVLPEAMSNIEMTIFNAQGIEVYNRHVTERSKEIRIMDCGLKAGFYTIVIFSDTGTFSERFVVN